MCVTGVGIHPLHLEAGVDLVLALYDDFLTFGETGEDDNQTISVSGARFHHSSIEMVAVAHEYVLFVLTGKDCFFRNRNGLLV